MMEIICYHWFQIEKTDREVRFFSKCTCIFLSFLGLHTIFPVPVTGCFYFHCQIVVLLKVWLAGIAFTTIMQLLEVYAVLSASWHPQPQRASLNMSGFNSNMIPCVQLATIMKNNGADY